MSAGSDPRLRADPRLLVAAAKREATAAGLAGTAVGSQIVLLAQLAGAEETAPAVRVQAHKLLADLLARHAPTGGDTRDGLDELRGDA